MTEPIVKKGVFERAGHRNVEWGIQFNNSDYGKRQVAYLWLKDNELHDDLQQFLDSLTRAELAEVTAVGNKDRG